LKIAGKSQFFKAKTGFSVEAYNKSMQKQEIREVVKLRMIGDSIFGERKGNQDAS
jgi:hypothetical protein